MYILFFIFRTDCCTNPNPIHLKSYRDIYTSQEQMESWLHPISSSCWYPLRANIYWGSRSFPPEMRAAEILFTRWTRMKCSFVQPLSLGLSGSENWTFITNKHGTCQEEYLTSQVVLCPKPPFSSTCSGGTLFSGRVPGSWLILGVSLRLEEDWKQDVFVSQSSFVFHD